MDDAKYLFYQEVRDKKRTATGAFHKKGGSKSKACTLPYENMKGKERRKYMESTTTTKKLGEIMDWKEVKKLPDEEKKICLEAHGHRYGWSSASVAVALGTSQTSVYTALKQLELLELFKEKASALSRTQVNEFKNKARKDRAAYEVYVAVREGVEEKTSESPEVKAEEVSVPTPKKSEAAEATCETVETPTPMKKDVGFNFVMDTVLLGEAFRRRTFGLSNAIDGDKPYKVTLIIEEV